MNVKKTLIAKGRVVLLALPLSALLLACAGDPETTGGTASYRYPPDSLLVVGSDAARPTVEQLTGPDGDRYTGRYINSLEETNALRRQSLTCIAEWKRRQMRIDMGLTPESDPPAYCVFTPDTTETPN